MIGFYLFLVLEKFLMVLPRRVRRAIFIGLGKLAYMLSKRYKKVVRDNLKFVYGENVDEEFVKRTTKYSFKLLLLNFLHTMQSRYYSVEQIAKKVTFENEEVVKKAQEQKRPIIIVTGHYGAWELAGSMVSAKLEPLMIVYKHMRNRYFEEYLLSSRAQWRMSYVERHGATRAMIKQLRSGGGMAILIDTNVNKKEAVSVDFLNHPTSQIKTTAYLARKFNAALLPALIHTDDDENYVIRFGEEIVPPKTDDEENDILVSTQMQTKWLSDEILKEPEPWFWLHRRFKQDYPDIYV